MQWPSIALIGCGAAAVSYYIPALKKIPSLWPNIYLVDRDLTRAKLLSEELKGSKCADDHFQVLDKIQGAIVATPHFLHYPVAMGCLSRHVHVFCEKPLAVSSAELHKMIEEASRNGVTLSSNNTRRMFPNFRLIKQMISSGELGTVQVIDMVQGEKFGWQSFTGFYIDPAISSKGVLLDIGAHVLDLLCWWLAEKPQVVEYHDDSFGGPESVALIQARLRECRIRVKLNRLSDIRSYYVLHGTKGTMECNPDEWDSIRWTPKGGSAVEVSLPNQERTYKEFVGTLVENFIRVTQGKDFPIIGGKDVCPSIELIDECYNGRRRFNLPWLEHCQVELHVN